MATALSLAVVTVSVAVSIDIVFFVPAKHFLLSPLANLVILVPIDLLDIQPEADLVTCNKFAGANLRLMLPFICLPLLRHHALEPASIVVEYILFSDDLRLRTRDLSN